MVVECSGSCSHALTIRRQSYKIVPKLTSVYPLIFNVFRFLTLPLFFAEVIKMSPMYVLWIRPYNLWIRPSVLWMCPQKPMNPSLGVMNPSPKSYESVPENLWIRPPKPMNLSPKSYESVPKPTYYYLIINKLQSLIYYIFYIYYYSNKKKRAVFYFFSLWICPLLDGWESPCIRQTGLLKQLTDSWFGGCWVRIRWGQIYNFSRMKKGFAVCFQRLIIFLLSLFFGGVTFLSEFCTGYVQDMSKKIFDQKLRFSDRQLCFSDLRFCPRKATVLSGDTSGFVGKLYGHSLIIRKLYVSININK